METTTNINNDTQPNEYQALRELNEQSARQFFYDFAERVGETLVDIDWKNQCKHVINGLYQYVAYCNSGNEIWGYLHLKNGRVLKTKSKVEYLDGDLSPIK